MGKKITTDSINKFLNRVPFKRDNTEVVLEGTICYLKLFGNKIAALEPNGKMWVSTAGWHTKTTKERLNALPDVRIHQRNWKWFLNGIEWDGSPQYIKVL
jgi:hypothetical protein